MMKRTFSVATWNIGGGILGESHQKGGAEVLGYHTELIKNKSPDILCLQEIHMYRDMEPSQADSIAAAAGYGHTQVVAISPSHLADDACLALAVLSRFPILRTDYTEFPNPRLTARGPTGTEWTLFDKGYLYSEIDLGPSSLHVVNAHCFPLHYFCADATEKRFASIWRSLRLGLLQLQESGITVAAIDLNYEPLEHLLGEVLSDDGYRDAFTATPTVPKGSQQDYILYDARLRLLATSVTPTEADHSYCQIELAMPSTAAKK